MILFSMTTKHVPGSIVQVVDVLAFVVPHDPGISASISARSLGRPAARLFRRNASRPMSGAFAVAK